MRRTAIGGCRHRVAFQIATTLAVLCASASCAGAQGPDLTNSHWTDSHWPYELVFFQGTPGTQVQIGFLKPEGLAFPSVPVGGQVIVWTGTYDGQHFQLVWDPRAWNQGADGDAAITRARQSGESIVVSAAITADARHITGAQRHVQTASGFDEQSPFEMTRVGEPEATAPAAPQEATPPEGSSQPPPGLGSGAPTPKAPELGTGGGPGSPTPPSPHSGSSGRSPWMPWLLGGVVVAGALLWGRANANRTRPAAVASPPAPPAQKPLDECDKLMARYNAYPAKAQSDRSAYEKRMSAATASVADLEQRIDPKRKEIFDKLITLVELVVEVQNRVDVLLAEAWVIGKFPGMMAWGGADYGYKKYQAAQAARTAAQATTTMAEVIQGAGLVGAAETVGPPAVEAAAINPLLGLGVALLGWMAFEYFKAGFKDAAGAAADRGWGARMQADAARLKQEIEHIHAVSRPLIAEFQKLETQRISIVNEIQADTDATNRRLADDWRQAQADYFALGQAPCFRSVKWNFGPNSSLESIPEVASPDLPSDPIPPAALDDLRAGRLFSPMARFH